MKKKLLIFLIVLSPLSRLHSQTVSVRVAQTSYSSVDPDGAGPATGSVVIRYELSATANLTADGIPFSMVYQSANLMATPTNTTVKTGPLAAAATSWNQNVDNRPGNPVSVTYGGINFDKRMIISFVEPSGNPNVPVGASFNSYVEITYWTLGSIFPQGGYITPEPGSIVPQNELSTDGGLTTYPYLSPNLNTSVALGQNIVPVLFSSYDVKCSDKGASLVWSTETEVNSSYFEIQKSINGNEWMGVAKVSSSGNSSSHKNYQYLDLEGGKAFYRIRQVDIDGHDVYTAVKTTACNNRAVSVTVYPTPAKNKVTVALNTDRNFKTDLQILDASGRIVYKQSAVINKGVNNIQMDVRTLAAGEYILVSSDPSIILNKKIIISR